MYTLRGELNKTCNYSTVKDFSLSAISIAHYVEIRASCRKITTAIYLARNMKRDLESLRLEARDLQQ
jgi:hypothetical protein